MSKTGKGVLGDTPLMTDEEIKCIESYLTPDTIMLEWGSGGSTLYFPKMVKKLISIESDKKWYDDVCAELKKKKYRNVRYFLEEPQLTNVTINIDDIHKLSETLFNKIREDFGIRSTSYRNYINKIDNLSYKTYDAILIDGRVRLECGIKALNYMGDDSVLFIHDYYKRPTLPYLEQYYDVIQHVGKYEHYKNMIYQFETEYSRRNTLVVMKKKEDLYDSN